MKKAKPIAALVLAAVIIMALAGVAVAAVQSGVLGYLFGDGQPTTKQQQMVQNVGVTHESDGVTTTLIDLVFDGRELSFGLQFEVAKNAFVVIDHVTIDGINAYEINSNISDMWLCAPFSDIEGAKNHGVTASIDSAYFEEADRAMLESAYQQIAKSGKAEISVGLTLLTPKASLAQVDTYNADTAAMWEQIDAIIARGDTPISADEPYEVVTGSKALGDAFHVGLPAQHPVGDASAYVDYANMTILDAFSIDFPITAADEADHELQETYQRSPISDGRVRITFDEVRFTPFATDIRLGLLPEPGHMTMDELAAIYKWFAIYDEKHAPIELLSRVTEVSGAGFEEQFDGTLIYRVELHLGALTRQPEVVNLVPYNELSSAEHPLWAYAIPIVYSSENVDK